VFGSSSFGELIVQRHKFNCLRTDEPSDREEAVKVLEKPTSSPNANDMIVMAVSDEEDETAAPVCGDLMTICRCGSYWIQF